MDELEEMMREDSDCASCACAEECADAACQDTFDEEVPAEEPAAPAAEDEEEEEEEADDEKSVEN